MNKISYIIVVVPLWGLLLCAQNVNAEFIKVAGGSYSQPDTLRYGVYHNRSSQSATLGGVSVEALAYIYLFQLDSTPISSLILNASRGYATAGLIDGRRLGSNGALLSDTAITRTPDYLEFGTDYFVIDYYVAESIPSSILYFTGGVPVADSGLFFNFTDSEFIGFSSLSPDGSISVVPVPVGWGLFVIGVPCIASLQRRKCRRLVGDLRPHAT